MAEISFGELMERITALSGNPNLDFFVVGESTMGQPIYGMHIGSYEGKQILIESGIHAREYPAVLVVLGMAEYLASNLGQINGGIYILPLVNPDGVRIVLDGVGYLNCENWQNFLIGLNGGNDDFSNWKASATGVDLNVNFPALWGGGAQNVFCPNYANFVGFYPASEREVRLLMDFTYSVQPNLTLSYHTKGDVIYYGFEVLSEEEIARDRMYADIIASVNGYTPIKTENSVGGYSDWVSEYLDVPAFTVEVGSASLPTPIPLSQVEPQIERNKGVPIALLDALNENS